MVKEKIPRVQDPETINRMMDESACRLDSIADAWHVLCTSRSLVRWRDRSIIKNQFDLARYFYLIHRMKPEVIVETGLQGGGSLLFFLDCLTMLRMEKIPYIGIDLNASPALEAAEKFFPGRPILLVSADCLADATIREVAPHVQGRRALIILDSVHTYEHTRVEIPLYASLCGTGSFLVAEDADHENRPILGNYGPATGKAVDEFFRFGSAKKLGFVRDRRIERMFGPFTVSPSAWLSKVV